MRFVASFVALGVIVVGFGWWLAGLHGSTPVTLFGTTIRAPTALWIVAVALLLLIVGLLVWAVGWLLRSGQRLDRWSARRRRAKGDASITRTLVALAAGEQADARREARRARVALGETPQTLLLAAEAERLSGDDRAAADIYRRLSEREDAGLLGLRGLFRQAMNRGDWDEAAAIARRAEVVHPGGTWLRDERAALAVHAGDWRQAQALAGPEAPRATYAVAAAEAAVDPAEGLRLARVAHKDHPNFIPATLAYARRLRATGRDGQAMDVLRDGWTREPVPEIAALALDPETDPQARVKRANKLVSGAPGSPETDLLLARLLLDADWLADARKHLDQVRGPARDQRRYWLLVAELEGSERGDTEIGRLAQRDALRRAAGGAADPAWHCEQCGTTLSGWRPTCPHCGATGRVRWGASRDVERSAALLPPIDTTGAIGFGAA